MFPQSNTNRLVESMPKPSRKSRLPSVASPIPSIWPGAIRLTSPSSASRLANLIALIIPMEPNRSFYLFISGQGRVRDKDGTWEVTAGDAFFFGPGEAHQLLNNGTEDFAYHVIA